MIYENSAGLMLRKNVRGIDGISGGSIGSNVTLMAENVSRGIYTALKALDLYGGYVHGDGADATKGEMMKEIFLNLEVVNPFSGYCVPKCIIATPHTDVEITTGMEGLIEYELEFIDGIRDTDKELFGYTYHDLYKDSYLDMIKALKENKYTRQAMLPVGASKFYAVGEDKPCLMELMFKVRKDDRLWCTAVFRSNDAVRAFPMNIWAIARLLKHISYEVGIPCGGINYVANSFHVYPGCENTLRGYITRYELGTPDKWAWTEDEYVQRKIEMLLELDKMEDV